MKNVDDHIGMKIILLLTAADRIIIFDLNTIHLVVHVFGEPTMLTWWEGFQ